MILHVFVPCIIKVCHRLLIVHIILVKHQNNKQLVHCVIVIAYYCYSVRAIPSPFFEQ